MEKKVNYIAVGLFVLVLGVMSIIAVLWLSVGLQRRETPILYLSIVNESVAGLNIDAPVKYQGVNVGKVRSISLDRVNPQQVILIFAIHPDIKIKVDTQAVIETQGLTGIAYVELSGGSINAPLLARLPGQTFPQILSKPSLSARLENVLSTALSNFDHTAASINALLNDENRHRFSQILKDISIVTSTLAAQKNNLSNGISNASITAGHAAKVSAELSPVLARISVSADAIANMANKVALASDSTQKASDEIGIGAHVFRADTLPELQNMMMELSALSVSLHRLIEQTERDPASLLRGRKTPAPDPGMVPPTADKP